MGESEQAGLRASDDERDAVRRRLDAAVNEGRLDLVEYDARLRAAFTATTRGELAGLTADLPVAVAKPEKAVAEPARRGLAIPGPWRGWTSVALIFVAIWAASSLASGHAITFWPAFPLLIWGAAILSGRIRGKSD